MKKKLAIASVAALGALALTACGPAQPGGETVMTTAGMVAGSTSPTTYVPQTTYTQPTDHETSEGRAERIFYEQLKGEGIYLDDATAYQAAATTCEFIDQGYSVEGLFHEIAADVVAGKGYGETLPGISDEDLPFIMGSAVGAFCPEHKDALR